MHSQPTARRTHSRVGRPTPEQAQRRHLELLDRALDVFLKKGFALTTMDDIAAANRMTKRTIYGLYRNKEALFKAALEREIVRSGMPETPYESLDREDLEGVLLAVARERVRAFVTPAGLRLQRLIYTEQFRFPDLLWLLYEKSTMPTVRFLIDLLRHHQDRGHVSLEKPETAVSAFMSMAVGGPARAVLTGVIPKESANLDEHIHYSVTLFLKGIQYRNPSRSSRTTAASA